MAELFQTTKQNISWDLKNIFYEGEPVEDRVVKEYLTTASDGKNYRTSFYNLEAIIAVGYRVKSHRGTQFRQWAAERLREYLVKGFVLDDERLAEPGGIDYFDELLERIRAILAGEKRFYQKVRAIYMLSYDYDPHNPLTQEFSKPAKMGNYSPALTVHIDTMNHTISLRRCGIVDHRRIMKLSKNQMEKWPDEMENVKQWLLYQMTRCGAVP